MENTLKVLKALSDETRFKIIQLLLRHNFCVGALAKRLFLSEAAISQHLKVLRHAGLVIGVKKGYFTHYTVNREILEQISQVLKKIAEQETIPEGKCHKKVLKYHDKGGKDKDG